MSSANLSDNLPPVDEAKLVCRIGDRMRVVTPAATDDDDPLVLGSIYEAVDRKYYGWDFALIEGEGPASLRILNSQVLTYLEPLH